MSGSYVHEMDEWRWDLGADGIVRLVSEGDVETIYVGARIAARTTAKVDEHCVLLPPAVRAAVDQGREAYRHADSGARARELRLRRMSRGWIGVLEGRNLTPTVILEDPLPHAAVAMQRSTPRARNVLARVAIGVVLLGALAHSFVSPTGVLHLAAEREGLQRLPHQTDLTTTLSNDSGSVTLRAPSDFAVDQQTASSLRIVRKELAEMFEVGIVPSPKTSDLDLVLHAATDSIKEKVAQTPSVRDFNVTFGDVVSATCNGEPGRVITGTFVSGAGRTFRIWACASLRPGIGIGEHLPSIQICDYLVSEYLAARDEPLFLSMLASMTVRDDALTLDVPSAPAPSAQPDPFIPLSTTLAGPPRTGSPSFAPRFVRIPPAPPTR